MLGRWQVEVAAGRRQMDVYADFNAVTLQITCEALFGTEMPRQQAQALAGAVRTAFEFFAARAATGFLVPEWCALNPIPCAPCHMPFISAIVHMSFNSLTRPLGRLRIAADHYMLRLGFNGPNIIPRGATAAPGDAHQV